MSPVCTQNRIPGWNTHCSGPGPNPRPRTSVSPAYWPTQPPPEPLQAHRAPLYPKPPEPCPLAHHLHPPHWKAHSPARSTPVPSPRNIPAFSVPTISSLQPVLPSVLHNARNAHPSCKCDTPLSHDTAGALPSSAKAYLPSDSPSNSGADRGACSPQYRDPHIPP